MSTTVVAFALSLLAGPAHYVLIFATQDTPAGVRPRLRSVHSFATWVQVVDGAVIEEFTISWIGRGTELWRPPHTGRNLTLAESIADARRHRWRVTLLGPYRVTPEAYQSAHRQYLRLRDGERTNRVRYAMLDNVSWLILSEPACHCVHALTDVTGTRIRTGARVGVAASEFVVQEYIRRGLIVGREAEDEWVWDAIRPDNVIVARRSGPPIPTAIGSEPSLPVSSEAELTPAGILAPARQSPQDR